MKLIRNRADARWLPARFNLGIFRLVAFVMARNARREDRPGIVLGIDRHQSTFENYLLSIWFVVSFSLYAFGLMRIAGTPPWVAMLLALPAAIVVLQVIVVGTGALSVAALPDQNHIRLVTAVLMSATILLSAWMATTAHWTRHVGRFALAGLVVNTIAAVIMRLLTPQVEALERAYENEG